MVVPVCLEELAPKLADFTCKLNANRAWSMWQFEAPPYAYAGLLSQHEDRKVAAMARLRADHDHLQKLELLAHRLPEAKELLDDVRDIFCTPVRLLYACYERDKYRVDSLSAKRQLASMLLVIPDTKSVEDVHQNLRDLQRAGRHMVSSKVNRTRAAIHSGVLESRGIPHRKVTKAEFVARFRERPPSQRKHFDAQKHKMNTLWTEIFAKRDWTSTTPETFRKVLAAWHWVRSWMAQGAQGHAQGQPERGSLALARFSALLPNMQVVAQRSAGGVPHMCLGSATWAALLCQLQPCTGTHEGRAVWLLVGKVRWVHVTDPGDWDVLPAAACSPLFLHRLYPGQFANKASH